MQVFLKKPRIRDYPDVKTHFFTNAFCISPIEIDIIEYLSTAA